MKILSKKRDESILGYLNFIGITLLLFVLSFILPYLKLPVSYKEVIFFLFAIDYVTTSKDKIVLPTQNKRIGTFYVNKKYLFQYLYTIIKNYYVLQIILIISCLIGLFLSDVFDLAFLIICIFSVIIQIFSLVLPYTFTVLNKLILLSAAGCLFLNYKYVVFGILLFNLAILPFELTKKIKGGIFWKNKLTKDTSDPLLLLIESFLTNKGLSALLMIAILTLNYLLILLLSVFSLNFAAAPVLFLYTSIFITILEVSVGNSKYTIDIDLSLIRLSVLNPSRNKKFFQNSQLMICTHLISLIQLVSVVGLIPILIPRNIKMYFVNLAIIPFNYFISYVYYRKADFLIRNINSWFKWSFIILYFLFIILLAAVGGVIE